MKTSIYLLLSLLWIVACGSKPTGKTGYIVSDNDAGTVSIMFAEPRANRQYCVYRKDFVVDTGSPVELLDLQARGDVQLLTPRTVAVDDLRHAVQAESVYTSNKFAAIAYAMFPTATVCFAAFTAWVASRNKMVGRATLLTCAASAALLGAATGTEAEGQRRTRTAVDAMLSPEMHRADETLPRMQRVLTWLATENSLPCNKEAGTTP